MDLQTLLMYAARVIALLVAIPVHESAHAWASYRLGDPTGKIAGRISLNPMRHFDLFGALAMMLLGFGWAKPVPIDTRYYKNRKIGMALSSLAGPVSNLLMAWAAMVVSKAGDYGYYTSGGSAVWFAVAVIFYYMVMINITLGIFNMLPVPPFDGSRIFLLFLPERAYFGIMRYERYLMLAVFGLLWIGALDAPLVFLRGGMFGILDALTGFVPNPFAGAGAAVAVAV